MKICVKCGRHYDDSFLICDVCDLYLIKEVASESIIDENNNSKERSYDSNQIKNNLSESSSRSGSRRSRVVAVDEVESPSVNTSNNSSRHTAFVESDENDIEAVYDSRSKRTQIRRRRNHHLGRRLLPVIRIVFPIILIVVATIFILLYWSAIREFLRACIIGAMVGGTIVSFMSLRSGRYFNPDAVIVGALGGAVVGCILKYNFLGTTAELTDLIYALMPCVIECAGIWLILRSVFRR